MKKRDLYYERIPTRFFRENVKYLGNILGRVIKEQEGQKFFELVEKVRKLSKANKINSKNNQTNQKVIKAIKKLSPKNSFKLNTNLYSLKWICIFSAKSTKVLEWCSSLSGNFVLDNIGNIILFTKDEDINGKIPAGVEECKRLILELLKQKIWI